MRVGKPYTGYIAIFLTPFAHPAIVVVIVVLLGAHALSGRFSTAVDPAFRDFRSSCTRKRFAGEDMIDTKAIESNILLAVEEGDHGLASDLWSQLCEQSSETERYWIERIAALRRACRWPEAEDCGQEAMRRFPDSVHVALCHAQTPYQSWDWQIATDRFEALRTRFDPVEFSDVLTTVLDQLFCCDQMANETAARNLLNRYWPRIREQKFDLRGELFEIGFLAQAPGYEKWSSAALSEGFRTFYQKRLVELRENRKWISREARDVLIVSLGQNCLPWILPNRWGLRPNNVNMSPGMVFDFLPALSDTSAVLIEQDFEPLLRPEALFPVKYPSKLPGLHNTALNLAFFHEKGAWWQHNNWERLIGAYRVRIENFRRAVRTGRRLYVYVIVGAGNVDRVIQAYVKHLDDRDSRLLIINLLKEPVTITSTHERVIACHIPYPEDYNWMYWLDYNSERGHAFERRVVNAIKGQLSLIGSPRRSLSSIWQLASSCLPKRPLLWPADVHRAASGETAK
jgi:hypothetical protein